MKIKSKIFCIGLNKTGTSSLNEAFKILGFKSVHFTCNKGNIKDIILNNYKNGDKLLLSVANYDAYSDWSHPNTIYLYKEFDAQYPDSKFILNTRNLKDWLISREKHIKRNQKNPNYKGSWLKIEKDVWKKVRQELHKDIFSHFKNRPEDLLVIDVSSGEGWEKLCPFLGVPIPNQPFPKKNQSSKQ